MVQSQARSGGLASSHLSMHHLPQIQRKKRDVPAKAFLKSLEPWVRLLSSLGTRPFPKLCSSTLGLRPFSTYGLKTNRHPCPRVRPLPAAPGLTEMPQRQPVWSLLTFPIQICPRKGLGKVLVRSGQQGLFAGMGLLPARAFYSTLGSALVESSIPVTSEFMKSLPLLKVYFPPPNRNSH